MMPYVKVFPQQKSSHRILKAKGTPMFHLLRRKASQGPCGPAAFGAHWLRPAIAGTWLVAGLLAAGPAPAQNVLTQHNDVFRTGAALTETVLNAVNVRQG